jgi:hypothetical protein
MMVIEPKGARFEVASAEQTPAEPNLKLSYKER